MIGIRAIATALLFSTGLAGCEGTGEPIPDGTESGRPNIIFIFTDDHAAHAISAYGSKINKTPNLDRIGNEGMIFKNCFVTNSICAPSRAVIVLSESG